MDKDYIIAKEFLARLPDHLKVKLCTETLAGVEQNQKTKKQMVKVNLAYLDKK